MKITLLTFIIVISTFSLAQPALTHSELNAVPGDKFYYATDPEFRESSPGMNQVWNFTGIPTQIYFTKVVLENDNSSFPGADVSIRSEFTGSDYHFERYRNYTDSGHYDLGEVITDPDLNTVDTNIFVLPYFVMQAPLSYGNVYFDTILTAVSIDGDLYDYHEFIEDKVDGAGTLTLPTGTFHNVLRVKNRYATEVYSSGLLQVKTRQETYSFYNSQQRSSIFFTTYRLDYLIDQGQIYDSSVSYANSVLLVGTEFLNIREAVTSGLNIYPNPATNTLTLSLSESELEDIVVTDMSGRTFRLNYSQSGSEVSADIEVLTSGIYFIRITYVSGKAETGRILKE